MRIWDLPCSVLCREHLLGEHRELHAIWAVLTRNLKGYSRHPETLRWKGRLAALWWRHQEQWLEIVQRGYRHHSPLLWPGGDIRAPKPITPIPEQRLLLRSKGCQCLGPLAP